MKLSSKRPRHGKPRVDSPVASWDGRLSFLLQRTHAGVHVERRQELTRNSDQTGVVSIQVFFANSDEFDRFCEADSLRYEYATCFADVKKAFNELIAH